MLLEKESPTIPVLRVPGELVPAFLEQAAKPVRVVLGDEALRRALACRAFVLDSLERGRSIYGATTGLGPMVSFAGREETADQCENTLNHLTTGHGADLEPAIVRATLLARLWSLAQGHSGVSVSGHRGAHRDVAHRVLPGRAEDRFPRRQR